MNWSSIPDRPTAHFNLYEHVVTGEVFASRKQLAEAGAWRVTGCLPLPWPTAAGSRWRSCRMTETWSWSSGPGRR
jgi:hypothetical protein